MKITISKTALCPQLYVNKLETTSFPNVVVGNPERMTLRYVYCMAYMVKWKPCKAKTFWLKNCYQKAVDNFPVLDSRLRGNDVMEDILSCIVLFYSEVLQDSLRKRKIFLPTVMRQIRYYGKNYCWTKKQTSTSFPKVVVGNPLPWDFAVLSGVVIKMIADITSARTLFAI